VIRLLALAQQQVALVQEGHLGQVVPGVQLHAVGPDRALLDEPSGVAARRREPGGDQEVDRIAEIVGPHRAGRYLAAHGVQSGLGRADRIATEEDLGGGIGRIGGCRPVDQIGELPSEVALGEPPFRDRRVVGNDCLDLVDGPHAEAEQALGDVGVIGLHPVLAKLVRAGSLGIEPHGVACRLAELLSVAAQQ
jgi:hypothetical protein